MNRLDNQRRLRLTVGDLFRLFLFAGCLAAAVLNLPNGICDYAHSRLIMTIGLLGSWRYSWWLTHSLRRQADELWPRAGGRAASC